MGQKHARTERDDRLSPEETVRWIERYRRNSRYAATLWYVVLVPVVFVVIWKSTGSLQEDVWLSTGAFAVVTLVLAIFTRRRANQAWTGRIGRKYQKLIRRSGENGEQDTQRVVPILDIETDAGRKVRVRPGADLYAYFAEGDRVMKVSGLDFPEKQVLANGQRACLVCGAVLPAEARGCRRCGGPIPDHATLCRLAGCPDAGEPVPAG